MDETGVIESEMRTRYPGITICRDDGTIVVRIPVSFHRRNGRMMVVADDGSPAELPSDRAANQTLVEAIAKAHRWQEQLESGEYASLDDLAAAVGVDRTYVGRMLRLTSLAPDIVQAIVEGNEPEGISLERLRNSLPVYWEEQRATWSPTDV